MESSGTEGIDLFKMVVTILMVCIALSAALFLFTRLYGVLNRYIDGTQTTVNAAAMDKLYELETMTKSADSLGVNAKAEDYPLVSMCAQAALETGDLDVLFYQLFDRDGISMKAYSEADLAAASIIVNGATQTAAPESDFANELLRYSGHRCKLYIYGDGDDAQTYPNSSCAVIVQLLD